MGRRLPAGPEGFNEHDSTAVPQADAISGRAKLPYGQSLQGGKGAAMWAACRGVGL